MVAEFTNVPIQADELPQLREQHFEAVDPKLLRVSLVGRSAFAVAVVVAGVLASLLIPSRSWIPLAAMAFLLVVTVLSMALRTLEVRNIAYQVRTHDLSYRSGVLVKTVSTVPFVRVQHARIRQGPVQRRFGLAALEVNSAGPDLHIEGLTTATAERLKALVVERSGDLAEDQ